MLNVCGLKSRVNYPEFVSFFNTYDILCFVETKLDDADVVSLPGFICISQPRKQTFLRKSGGIAFCVKENLAKYVKQIESHSDYVMWVQLDRTLINSDENLMLGISYVPPTQSKYYNAEEILSLEREITSVCSNNKYVLITGDINARTAKLSDYIRADDFLSDVFDFDNETRSFFDKVNILEQYNIPTERESRDNKTNNTGNWLIETCKNNNLFIVNGRVGKDKYLGAPTFRDKSLIDYTICTAECFAWLSDFEIIELDAIFSDGHSLLSWSLQAEGLRTYNNSNSNNEAKNTKPKFRWSENTKEQFIAQINLAEVLHVKQKLDTLEPNSENINRYTNEISTIFENAAQKSLKYAKASFKKRQFDKPWFGPACKMARKQYHKAKNMYKLNRCQRLKNNLQVQSKNFKKVMNKYILLYKIDKAKKLRNMQYKSPKEYWKYLNSLNNNKNPRPQPTIAEFYEHYKNINDNKYDNDMDINMHLNDSDEILNSYITSDEIRKCINNLKNGKSAGGDFILNEYLKSTKEIFLPVYETLFNKIFDSGILPTPWLEGSITPIYKNKGNSSEPKNYRPITILSCLGKVFTAVLNNRLTSFLDNSDMLNENQAGFRKEYSTSDHIFVLSSLIEILKVKRQKLYCAFIDFSQAFDSVWRGGLWRKLLFNSIKGKFFRIIYNMYDTIKSCVKFNNQSSTFFACKNGVRQGENLSPLLFAMYLNDLEAYLLASGTEPINLEFQNDEILCFLKLLILLYADDTIIISDNKDDFQKGLDAFHEYCQMWKLQVNYDKTNIIVFNARNINTFAFKIGEHAIEVTDKYKYLGTLLFKSGSFINTKKHIAEQARKAMHLLFMRANNLDLPLDLQMKLFDNTVLPILTYSSEIWGYGNLEIIERVHTEFLRKITRSRKSTPKYMLYAELGRHPIEIDIKSRMINYWVSILNGKKSKFAYQIYLYVFNSNSQFKWPNCIKSVLDKCGLNCMWLQQFRYLPRNIAKIVKTRLSDQYLQHWSSELQVSSKGTHYALFKDNISLERYITILHGENLLNMFKFRTCNHKFPIEKGRWENIELSDRKCELCQKNDIGDNFHYLLICPLFDSQRKLFIEPYYYKRPNVLKYKELLNITNERKLRKLSLFMKHLISFFK